MESKIHKTRPIRKDRNMPRRIHRKAQNRTIVIVRFTVPGFHCWPKAPNAYKYLREIHRHLFYFEAGIKVSSLNREIEIINFSHIIENQLIQNFRSTIEWGDLSVGCNFNDLSCEMIAEKVAKIIKDFDQIPEYVIVLEDNENGAKWINNEI